MITLPKPREVAAALDVTPRKAGRWLRGDTAPTLADLARILAAFPHLDPRWVVGELARRREARR